MKQILHSFLLLLTLLLPVSASSYDFAVDGIYYNKTSSNTVEVTYKNQNFASYSGEVVIPSTVMYNNVTYTVTAIGDNAFYYCTYLVNVTIPETIISIGNNAFCNCYFLSAIYCLAETPPTLNGTVYNGCISSEEFEYGTLIYYYEYEYDDVSGNGVEAVLNVPSEALDFYKSDGQWISNFSYIVSLGAEITAQPTILVRGFDDLYGKSSFSYFGWQLADSMYMEIKTAEECKIYFGYISTGRWDYQTYGTDWREYGGDRLNPRSFYYDYYSSNYTARVVVYAYAVAEGKVPSPVSIVGVSYNPYFIVYEDLIDEYDIPYSYNCGKGGKSEIDICDYNGLENNGFYYEIIDDSSLEVVKGMVNHCTEHYLIFGYPHYNWEEQKSFNYPPPPPYSDDGEYHFEDDIEYLYYHGNVVIPEYTSGINDYWGNDVEGYVTSIGNNAFYNCTDLLSVSIPTTVTNIGSNAFAECGEIPTLLMPVNIQTIGNNAFSGTSINYLYLSGEGEWTGGCLDITVQRLDIASDITAIPGLKVNPREVYSYAAVPPTCDGNTFTDYTGTLHVPESSLAAYFTAPYWCNFANIVGDAVELTGITINKNSAELLVGEQLTLSAAIQPNNASVDSIAWSSSNGAIATVVNGVVTAMGKGECDIIATALDKQAICHLTVDEVLPTSITLDQHQAKLLPNHILTLTPTVRTMPIDLVVTSTNASVAAARLANGKVQVVGVAPGRAIIKVSSADGNVLADSCIVDVYTQVGDVNLDGFVKISDVTCMIDYLLGGNVSPFDVGNADMNYDGTVSIGDITALIDYLLSGETAVSTYETFTVNGVSFSMVRVAGGTFMMGATEEQGDDATDRERPVHQVTLTSSYLIGETEVTQELWEAVMGTNPSMHTGDLQKPVEYVTWPQCQEFITQLNALTGQNFRLPTEAEWEFAARGGNRGHGYKYAGSNNVDDVAWYTGTTTHPVALLQPNELGLYDMSGNVDEWINDYWSNYTSAPQVDPTGPETGTNHPYRGGSWYGGATASRVSCRMYRSETFKRGTLGLRLAL